MPFHSAHLSLVWRFCDDSTTIWAWIFRPLLMWFQSHSMNFTILHMEIRCQLFFTNRIEFFFRLMTIFQSWPHTIFIQHTLFFANENIFNVYNFDKKESFSGNLFPKTTQFVFISVLTYLCERFTIAKLWCCFVLHIERLLSSFVPAYDETGYFRVNKDIKHSNDVHHQKHRWMKWMFAITDFPIQGKMNYCEFLSKIKYCSWNKCARMTDGSMRNKINERK